MLPDQIMTDTGSLTHEDFAACLEQDFEIILDGDTVLRSVLVDVQSRGNADPQAKQRQAYSVILRGPMEPVLDQRIYRLRNQTLGALDLFLVPVGPDETGMRYEAVFN